MLPVSPGNSYGPEVAKTEKALWLRTRRPPTLVHHIAATQIAAMHNADSCNASDFPYFRVSSCNGSPCFATSPCKLFDIARIAFRPLLSFFLSPQWFPVHNNKNFTKSHNAAMAPLAMRDGHRKRKRKRSDAVHKAPYRRLNFNHLESEKSRPKSAKNSNFVSLFRLFLAYFGF